MGLASSKPALLRKTNNVVVDSDGYVRSSEAGIIILLLSILCVVAIAILVIAGIRLGQ
jgi:hypothetical protein